MAATVKAIRLDHSHLISLLITNVGMKVGEENDAKTLQIG